MKAHVSDLPSIDVVVPTLNCAGHLDLCLRSIRSQDYQGDIRIIVVDGGSTDDTVEVARKYAADVIVNPGQYGTGLSGARHFGEMRATADVVWNIDADNQLLGEHVALDLVRPLLDDPTINISIPVIRPGATSSLTNQWLSSLEEVAFGKLLSAAHRLGGYFVTPDLDYGLPNCALIRRSVLLSAGGYDSDVMLLMRLRKAGQSRAAIVPAAEFSHEMAKDFADLARKIDSRVRRFGAMTPIQLAAHLSGGLIGGSNHGTRSHFARFVLDSLLTSVRQWLLTKDRRWLICLPYCVLLLYILSRHPVRSVRVVFRYLG